MIPLRPSRRIRMGILFCLCYCTIHPSKRVSKFDSRSFPAVYLGLSDNTRAFRVRDLRDGTKKWWSVVKMVPTVFPYRQDPTWYHLPPSDEPLSEWQDVHAEMFGMDYGTTNEQRDNIRKVLHDVRRGAYARDNTRSSLLPPEERKTTKRGKRPRGADSNRPSRHPLPSNRPSSHPPYPLPPSRLFSRLPRLTFLL